MTWAYGLMELAATAIEGVTILCAVTHISCERYFGRRHKSLILLLAFIYTVIITAMNSFSAFSFVTIGIAVTLIVWSSYFTSKGSLLLRSTSAVISILIVSAVDYICLFIFCMIICRVCLYTARQSRPKRCGISLLSYYSTFWLFCQ